MTEPLFRRIVVPIANRDDATATATALRPHVAGTDRTVIVVHVIEKSSGAPDKASVEQRKRYAEDVFAIVTDEFDDSRISIETDLRYGTDIATAIIVAAHDSDASAIAFTPRGGSRWRKLLTGDVSHNLIEDSDIPVLVLPRPNGERSASEIRRNARD
ncbi:universal stress protein [Natrinema sp. CGMCC1.2065]|uniref:universal stress protein n=1 Tax=Natrinema sp. CGMCC1.2065 TaxID=3445767 RepID=UPI003F4A279B